jgi:carboxylesterase
VPLFRLIDAKPVANLFKFPLPAHVGIKDQRIRDFVRNAKSGAGAQPVATPGGAVLERRRLVKVVLRHLSTIRQPALIVHAREDDYAGLDNAAYLQAQLGGPVDLVVLEDCYHMVTIDRQREVVAARTVAFAERVSGAAAQTAPGGIGPDRSPRARAFGSTAA